VAGDPAGWLDRHGDALYAFAVVRVRNKSTAEDLVQETLLAALSARAGFRGQSSERTWLTAILKNKVIDHLRRGGRELQFEDGTGTGADDEDRNFDQTGHWRAEIPEWVEPEKQLQRDQFWSAVHECLDGLPERLRTLFALRELDGCETDELLEMLDISSANNLWVMMSRARIRMRQCLERKLFAS
jgi:RNA polymerase sigma-70 factor (ECF subfamily)